MQMMIEIPGAVAAPGPVESVSRMSARETDSQPPEEAAAPFVQALAAAVQDEQAPAAARQEQQTGTLSAGDLAAQHGNESAAEQSSGGEAVPVETAVEFAVDDLLSAAAPQGAAGQSPAAVSTSAGGLFVAEQSAAPQVPGMVPRETGAGNENKPAVGHAASAAAAGQPAPAALPEPEKTAAAAGVACESAAPRQGERSTDSASTVIGPEAKTAADAAQKAPAVEARLMNGEQQAHSSGKEQSRPAAPLATDAFATQWQTDDAAEAPRKEREHDFARHLLERLSGDGLAARLNAAQQAERMPLEPAAKSEAGSLPAASVAKDPVEVVRFAREIQAQLTRNNTEMRLKLHPEHLGEVSVRVRLDGDVATLALRTENNSAREALQANFAQLREALAQQGIRVDSIDVQLQQNFTAMEQRGGSLSPEDQAAGRQPDWSSRQERANARHEPAPAQSSGSRPAGRSFVDVLA
ncbi:MAG: flagellar hook-length control protein FliK [Candidatus Omnitrophica bacterium]|nr:flagellar hook-length control protein FliK [Candidatus Omnitrophota bacterium]